MTTEDTHKNTQQKKKCKKSCQTIFYRGLQNETQKVERE